MKNTSIQSTKLKKGMQVMCYDKPHLPDGTIRILHHWFVKYDDGQKADRWVCPLDILHK